MSELKTVFTKLLDSVSQPSIDLIERKLESKYNSGSLLDSLLPKGFREENANEAKSLLNGLRQSNPLVSDDELVAIADDVASNVVERFENS